MCAAVEWIDTLCLQLEARTRWRLATSRSLTARTTRHMSGHERGHCAALTWRQLIHSLIQKSVASSCAGSGSESFIKWEEMDIEWTRRGAALACVVRHFSDRESCGAACPQADTEAAEADLLAACRHALLHGPLLALRYAVAAVPWTGKPPA